MSRLAGSPLSPPHHGRCRVTSRRVPYGMAPTSATVEALTRLGLTEYESRAYLTLMARDRYTAAELARSAGIPRQRIYDVLGSLSERGLVRSRPGPVARYTAVDPQAAANRLMTVHREAFEELEKTTDQLVDQLGPVWAAGRAEDAPMDFIEIVRDRTHLAEVFADLQSGAQYQLLTQARNPSLVVENPAGLRATRRLSRAGGDVRCLYEYAMLDDAAAVAETERFVRAGELARLVPEVPMRLCIADGARVLMSLRDPVAGGTSDTAVLIEHPALAGMLVQAYEAAWVTGTAFE